MTTTTEIRTDIRVPPGTVQTVEDTVLGPLADMMEDHPTPTAAYMASGAWNGLRPLPSGHVLRFDLSDPGHVAAALWLTLRLRQLLSRDLHTVPEGVVEKREVLARIGNDLDAALRRAGVEVAP